MMCQAGWLFRKSSPAQPQRLNKARRKRTQQADPCLLPPPLLPWLISDTGAATSGKREVRDQKVPAPHSNSSTVNAGPCTARFGQSPTTALHSPPQFESSRPTPAVWDFNFSTLPSFLECNLASAFISAPGAGRTHPGPRSLWGSPRLQASVLAVATDTHPPASSASLTSA